MFFKKQSPTNMQKLSEWSKYADNALKDKNYGMYLAYVRDMRKLLDLAEVECKISQCDENIEKNKFPQMY
jgi:hypothetical protein